MDGGAQGDGEDARWLACKILKMGLLLSNILVLRILKAEEVELSSMGKSAGGF